MADCNFVLWQPIAPLGLPYTGHYTVGYICLCNIEDYWLLQMRKNLRENSLAVSARKQSAIGHFLTD